jgi:formate/nitrite transporter FocA (FNT family)
MVPTGRSFGGVRPVRTLWSEDMDYVKPADVAASTINAGRAKLGLSPFDLITCSGLAGAILATATSLAFIGTVQTNQPLAGALIFAKTMLANWCFLGNLVGGFLFTGLALYATLKSRLAGPAPLMVPAQVAAE